MRSGAPVATVLVVLALAGAPGDSAAASSDEAIAARLTAPMAAVVRLVADQKWAPLLDEIVQKVPAAASLGSRWNAQSAAWQRARKSLGARFARSVEAYVKSHEMERALQAAVADNLSPEDAAAYEKALNGPAGPTIIRYEATTTFMSAVMSGSPKEPRIGQPGWNERLISLRKTFDERVGAAVPRENAAQKLDAGRFLSDPIGQKAGQVWFSVVGKTALKIDGVINLMLFDEQSAIQRELAEAAAAAR